MHKGFTGGIAMSKKKNNSVHRPEAGGYYGKIVSKRDFYDLPAHHKQVRHIHLSCVVFYFIVVMSVMIPEHIVNFITNLVGVGKFLNMFPNVWIDYMLVIVLCLIIQFTKSRIASSILFAYTAVDCLYKYYTYHIIEGVWPLLVAGYMVTLTFELAKAYEQYKQTGIA